MDWWPNDTVMFGKGHGFSMELLWSGQGPSFQTSADSPDTFCEDEATQCIYVAHSRYY